MRAGWSEFNEVKTYANRGTGRRRTADGKYNRRVVILALIADESAEVEPDKLSSHVHNFLPTNDRGKIPEPLEYGHSGGTVFLDGGSRTAHGGLCALGNVQEI